MPLINSGIKGKFSYALVQNGKEGNIDFMAQDSEKWCEPSLLLRVKDGSWG